MQDYYSLFTWAMDRQSELQREARERRGVRESRPVTVRLRWPVEIRRRDDR